MTQPQESQPDKTQILGPDALRAAQEAAPGPPEGQATVILPAGLPMLEPLPLPGDEATQPIPLVPLDPEAETRAILEGPDATLRLQAGSPPVPLDDPTATRLLPVGEPAALETQRLSIGSPTLPAPQDLQTLEIPPDQLPAPARKGAPIWAWVGLGALVLVLAVGSLWALRPDLLGLAVHEERKQADDSEPSASPTERAEPAAPEIPPAIRPYVEKADKGDAAAMRMLGVMYYNGLNVPRNEQEGLKWYRKAAEAGSKAAAKELKALEGRPPTP